MADVYEIAREGLELAEKATPGEWRVGNPCTIGLEPGEIATCGPTYRDDWREAGGCCVYVERSIEPHAGVSRAPADAALIAHAGTHYAALCRALLAQKAVVEAAVEQERCASDMALWVGSPTLFKEQHVSACKATERAVRAMKEQTR